MGNVAEAEAESEEDAKAAAEATVKTHIRVRKQLFKILNGNKKISTKLKGIDVRRFIIGCIANIKSDDILKVFFKRYMKNEFTDRNQEFFPTFLKSLRENITPNDASELKIKLQSEQRELKLTENENILAIILLIYYFGPKISNKYSDLNIFENVKIEQIIGQLTQSGGFRKKSKSRSARTNRKSISRSRKRGGAKKSKSKSPRKARKSRSARKTRRSKSKTPRKARKARKARKSKSKTPRKARKSKSKTPKRVVRKHR